MSHSVLLAHLVSPCMQYSLDFVYLGIVILFSSWTGEP